MLVRRQRRQRRQRRRGLDRTHSGHDVGRRATESTSAPPTLGASDADTVTFVDRDARVWRIGGDPDTITSAFGSIWVKFDDGKVLRFNPASGKVLATIDTGYSATPACELLGADDHRIWTCAGPNRLLPIDPRNNIAGKPVRSSILGDQVSLPWSAELIWTIRGDGQQLDGHSTDGSVATTVDLGAFCTDLAASEALLVAVCPSDAKVVLVDPKLGTVVGEVALDDPRRAAVADFVWVGYGAGTAQIDPQTLEIVAVYGVTPGIGGALWASDTDVWMRNEGQPFLTHIDPVRHEIVETVKAPQFTSGGSVLGLGDEVWATGNDEQLIVRLSST